MTVMLRNKGYEECLPTYRRRRLWSDRIKEIHFPLLPSYVSCGFNLRNRLLVLTTPGVVCVVGAGKVPLPVGEKVRIGAGPLRGIDGILLWSKGSCRLIVSATRLQRSIAVEIGEAQISARI